MTEIPKERREKLREDAERLRAYGYPVPVRPDELRALLNMADERDRFRALLGDTLEDNGHVGYTHAQTLNRIESALNGSKS